MATVPVVNEQDKRFGLVSSIVVVVISVVLLFLLKFEFPDPLPVDTPLTVEAEIDEMILEALVVESGSASGQGQSSDDEVGPVQEEVQEVLTNPTSPVKVNTGKSNKTNTNKPTTNNTPTTTQTSTNPFGGGGNQTGTGSGNGIGKDQGDGGNGSGTQGLGDGKGRVRYNEISESGITVTAPTTVKLILIINAKGQVVSGEVVASGTTTNDQRIINKVIAACKNQLKYNEEPGASLQKVYYTVQINPN